MLIWYLLLGLIASFIGSIPFGTVNVLVIDATINKSFKAGRAVAIGTGVVESFHTFLALSFGILLSQYLETNIFIKVLVVLVLLMLAAYFLFRMQSQAAVSNIRFRVPDFLKGVILGLINPQALPYYVFAIAYLQSLHVLEFGLGTSLWLTSAFIIGTACGRFLALLLYGYLSSMIQQRIQLFSFWMNRSMAAFFIFLAMIQVYRIFV